MELTCIFGNASGPSTKAHVSVVLRYEAAHGRFKPDWGDSWLCRGTSHGPEIIYGAAGWVTGAWYSPMHTGFFVGSQGAVYVFRELDRRSDSLLRFSLPSALRGVFGVDDDFVLAFGDKGPRTGAMFLWDGAEWSEIESPGFGVLGVHGTSRELLVAVGMEGLLARWDGERWHRMASPEDDIWSAVWVVSPDEIYVSGNPASVLRGSLARGFAPLVRGPGPMPGLAVWRDELWVGAGKEGLYALREGELRPVKKLLDASTPLNVHKLDARGELLVGSHPALITTSDGTTFDVTLADAMLRSLEGAPIRW